MLAVESFLDFVEIKVLLSCSPMQKSSSPDSLGLSHGLGHFQRGLASGWEGLSAGWEAAVVNTPAPNPSP